jgi:hypothetical protein
MVIRDAVGGGGKGTARRIDRWVWTYSCCCHEDIREIACEATLLI